MYYRCTGIYKFGNNTYPQGIRSRSNLGHIFGGEKMRLMGREIWYNMWLLFVLKAYFMLLNKTAQHNIYILE